MSFILQSPPLFFPSFPLSPKTLTLKPLNPFPLGRRPRPITALCVSDHDLLASSPNLAGDGRGSSDQLPAVRTYETDLACLTLVGSVDFEQALTAAAADGGDTAEEHLASGMEIMVMETLSPASNDEHSTVSTRLVSLFGWVVTVVLVLLFVIKFGFWLKFEAFIANVDDVRVLQSLTYQEFSLYRLSIRIREIYKLGAQKCLCLISIKKNDFGSSNWNIYFFYDF